jgi:hypothetical protein
LEYHFVEVRVMLNSLTGSQHNQLSSHNEPHSNFWDLFSNMHSAEGAAQAQKLICKVTQMQNNKTCVKKLELSSLVMQLYTSNVIVVIQ